MSGTVLNAGHSDKWAICLGGGQLLAWGPHTLYGVVNSDGKKIHTHFH